MAFSSKEKTLTFVTAAVAVTALLYMGLIEPCLANWVLLDKQIAVKKNALLKNNRLVSKDYSMESGYAQLTSRLRASEHKEEDVTSGLYELEKIAKECSVFILTIKPQSTRELGESTEMLLDVSAEADMQSLAKFLYEVESGERLFRVSRVSITPGNRSGKGLKCSFLISKVLIV